MTETHQAVENFLTVNNKGTNFHSELVEAFQTCTSFKINVAFVTFSGIQILLDTLKSAEIKGIKGKVITSTYLNFTEPKSMRKLNNFTNIELKIFVAKREQGFHPKSYIFEYCDHYKVFVGSSNLTQAALKSNIEWNVKTISKKNAFIDSVYAEFEKVWLLSDTASESLILKYEGFLKSLTQRAPHPTLFTNDSEIIPNSMQEEAIFRLSRLRQANENKALVIAATGSGKTFMSAFDVKAVNPQTMLFVVHRESILHDAIDSFAKVLGTDKSSFGLLTGSCHDFSSSFLFATNLSIANHIDKFAPDYFDYIVIDEAHHITANSYQKILKHFTAKFTLGMTATPERGDANSIYENFDHNIALEIRLRHALEENLVVPFHYFGITDASGIDYKSVNLLKIEDVAELLKTHYRVEHIVGKIDFYGYEGDDLKGVGFCANIDHAEYMASQFNRFGHQAIALTGANSERERQQTMLQLADNNHPLCMIFTVDIFNEGIDIPAINLVLMLRPTASPVIFLQQLGRGLRKHPNKSFLTVLDFIGNHNRSFMIAIALYGQTSFDKDSLKVAVKRNFIDLPGCTHVSLDEIAKERILEQLENENFNALQYLKEEYYAFKSICNTASNTNKFKLPMLNLYLMIDGSPEPLKFINYSKTYIEFLSRVEPDNAVIQKLRLDTNFKSAYRFVSDHLPAKRVPEFYILKLLITQKKVTIKQVAKVLTQNGYKYNASSIVFAFEYLAGQYFDNTDVKKYSSLGYIAVNDKSELDQNVQSTIFEVQEQPVDGTGYPSYSQIEFIRSNNLAEAISSSDKRDFLNDAIDYGISRHEQEFGDQINSEQLFGLYKQYNMRDVAFVCEYSKKHSAFRGAGVFSYAQHFFLFIELHKDENAIAYKDKFISRQQLQWDSPESSRPDKGRGLNIIQHVDKGLKLHLFVRKFRSIDRVVQPYIYIGEGVYISHTYEESHKPITFQLNLENVVPTEIYAEFTTTN